MLDLVRRLTDPYANFLDPTPQPGPTVCPTCRSARDPRYQTCRACADAVSVLGSGTADLVVPVALAVKGRQLAHELWHYKNSPAPSVQRELQRRLTAVLWRFLESHESCLAARLGTRFDVVTTVPSLRGRTGPHPLQRIVATGIKQTAMRYRELLVPGEPAGDERTFDAGRFEVRTSVGGAVLLVEDTWTKGSRAQSAAAALKMAGAPAVAVVVLGRHFDPGYAGNQAFLTALQREQRFEWDRCCLEPH